MIKLETSNQLNYSQQQKKDNKNPQFKGLVDGTFRFLATNQAVGANVVDVCSMVLPRTYSDWSKRGAAAGLETGRRESMGTINDSLLGAYGLAAGALTAAAMGINGKYNTSINNVLAAPETLDILAQNKFNQLKNGKTQLDYLKETLSSIKFYNPTDKGNVDASGYKPLKPEKVNEIAEMFDSVLNDKVSFNDWTKTKQHNSLKAMMNKIIEETGAESQCILQSSNNSENTLKSSTNLETLLRDIFRVSETFNKDKVKEAFDKQISNNADLANNEFLKSTKKFMKNRTLGGFLIASLVGLAVQPLNIYLTKRKTGSDGFVGVEGRQKDNSNGFKALKLGSSVAFFAMILKSLDTGLKGFMDKMAFKGLCPTVNQLKGVYGVTIISRIMAARDKDELRESLTKDTLGYLSWLVLGGIINKMTASALDMKGENSVLNSTTEKGKGAWNFLKHAFKSELKTRDEVLIETLAKNNIKTIKNENGNVIAKSFKEMLEDLDSLSPEIKKITKRRLRTLNFAQIAGYAFSCVVLGYGIPNLNIYITNKLDKMRKEKDAKLEEQNINTNNEANETQEIA